MHTMEEEINKISFDTTRTIMDLQKLFCSLGAIMILVTFLWSRRQWKLRSLIHPHYKKFKWGFENINTGKHVVGINNYLLYKQILGFATVLINMDCWLIYMRVMEWRRKEYLQQEWGNKSADIFVWCLYNNVWEQMLCIVARLLR